MLRKLDFSAPGMRGRNVLFLHRDGDRQGEACHAERQDLCTAPVVDSCPLTHPGMAATAIWLCFVLCLVVFFFSRLRYR